jgi:hypothetical protein
MPLINCPACGHSISTEAEACPQCGHPNRKPAPKPSGLAEGTSPAAPTCYACSAPATTRCQSCGALSCAVHLHSIYVSHGQGGAYELRCDSCHSSAITWKILGPILVLIVGAIFYFAVIAPKQRAFDQQWNQGPVPQDKR